MRRPRRACAWRASSSSSAASTRRRRIRRPAEVSGRLRHEARAAADLPVVGDWVLVAWGGDADRGVVQARLERRSTISRKAAGRASDEQVIAANVDTLFVVTAFAGDLNPRRLERYLTAVWDAGAVPVVVAEQVGSGRRRRWRPWPPCGIVSPSWTPLPSARSPTSGLAPLEPYLNAAATSPWSARRASASRPSSIA